MARSFRSQAVEQYLVRHRGRGIKVYQMSIPGCYGKFSKDVLALAAERAYKRGWRHIVLTWADLPGSTCFQDGYCHVLALNLTMARTTWSHYMMDEDLCRISRAGDIFNPPPRNMFGDEQREPFDYQYRG